MLFTSCQSVRCEELTVSAALSLREALYELAKMFESAHPGTKIIYNLSASGYLAQQIVSGAPIDIFISADRSQMDRLLKLGLIKNPIRELAGNRLVIVYPAGDKPVSSFQELLSLSEIVVGNPVTVPVGTYAREAMKHEGVWDSLVSRKRLIFADSVRQALDYVIQSDVDAGFVYATDAKLSPKVKVGYIVPENFTNPIIYPMALVAESKHLQLGEAFLTFLTSAPAKRVLSGKGFINRPQ
jgi:molybdate transport system substrate-binding protein